MLSTEVKDNELDHVLSMYANRKLYNDMISVYTFCEEYLARCECCQEIVYYDELKEVEDKDGKIIICCENCAKEIEEENKIEYDLIDEDAIYDEHRLGLL